MEHLDDEEFDCCFPGSKRTRVALEHLWIHPLARLVLTPAGRGWLSLVTPAPVPDPNAEEQQGEPARAEP